MTAKNNACRWSRLSSSLPVLITLLARASASEAAGLEMPMARLALTSDGPGVVDASHGQELYLEVVLNRAPTGRLSRFVERDGGFFASAATLRELGLKWPGSATASGLLALDALPGLQAGYDVAAQRMWLDAPLEMLDRAPVRLGIAAPDVARPDPAMRAPGLVMNYDVRAQHADDGGTLAGWNELRLFGVGPGIFGNTLNTRLASGDAGARGRHRNVRLDTYWQLDMPERMLTLNVGDGITGAVPWSRPTRIGGIRLSRNFSLQPYRITAPLASFAGEAALPSTVDLFIDGIRQSSQPVAPGQFQIDSAPRLNGTGQAQLVITDINGYRRVLDFTLYGTSRLLEPGLSDWSLDLGMVRRDYGLESFAYADDPMLSASLRRGLNDRFTVETHAEATRGLEMAGVGGVWVPGARSGAFNAAVAGSRSDDEGNGRQHSLGYEWNARGFNFSAGTLRRSAGFRDVASLEGSPLPLRTDQAFVGLSTPLGQWNTGYVRQRHQDTASRYLTLGWSHQIGDGHYLNLHLNRDLEQRRGYGAFLSWSMPLDRHTSVSAGLDRGHDARNVVLEANRTIPGDLGGWGWRAQTMLGDNRNGQAQIAHLGRYGQWTAGAGHWRRDDGATTTAWAGAHGGLLWMAGRLQAMRHVDDAFAMVSTQGVPGVPIRLENRLIGHTDEDGLLLINRLNAWQRNKLSIDPLSLPLDMRIDHTELYAVPAGRSGLLAGFPMRRILSVQASVRDAAGRLAPAGSPVWRADADPETEPPLTVIGHDGLLYLQDPPARARLRVRVEGRFCEIILPELPRSEGFADLDDMVCR